jgi:hypothetical protein
MTNDILLLVIAGVIVLGIVRIGLRRREPVWAIGGEVIGFVTLAIGIRWASQIGADALWAAFVAAAGCAIWAQAERLGWLRTRRS